MIQKRAESVIQDIWDSSLQTLRIHPCLIVIGNILKHYCQDLELFLLLRLAGASFIITSCVTTSYRSKAGISQKNNAYIRAHKLSIRS